jgi:hypothetical protein
MDSTLAGVCPGSCNVRYREAWDAYRAAMADYDPLDPDQPRPEPPSIRGIPGDPVWCQPCQRRVRECLAQLDTLAAMLGWTADGHATALSSEIGRVSGTAEPMSPSEAADELKDLMLILTDHETAYREYKGIDLVARRGFLASASSECIAWLGHQLTGILASPLGEGFGLDVLEWHRQWKRRAKAGKRRLTKPLRCVGCSMLTLVWEEGSGQVNCQNPDCNRVYTYDEYEAIVEERAGQRHQPEPGQASDTAA